MHEIIWGMKADRNGQSFEVLIFVRDLWRIDFCKGSLRNCFLGKPSKRESEWTETVFKSESGEHEWLKMNRNMND